MPGYDGEEYAPLQVVAVDDELPILDELCAFPWESHGAKLMACCENGAEALEFCCTHRIDLVICDVVMPVMDGLTLLKKLREASLGTQFVLLTCHESFRYAHEAIRMGALDYIVKLNMEDDLVKVLAKARDAIASARHATSGKDVFRRNALARLFRGMAGKHPDITAFRAEIGKFAALDYPLDLSMLFVSCPLDEGDMIQEEVLGALASIAVQKDLYLEAIPLFPRQFLLLDRNPHLDLEGRLVLAVEALNSTPFQISQTQDDVRIFASMSRNIGGDRQLCDVLSASKAWHMLSFYDDRTKVFARPGDAFCMLSALRQSDILRRGNLLKQTPRALMEYVTGELAPFFLVERVDPGALKSFFSRWLIDLLDAGADMRRASQINEHVMRALTLDEMVDAFEYLVTHNTSQQPLHPEIQRALELIDQRMDEPLTLGTVAKEVALSPYYLSRLFHAQTGRQFNKYVMERRIERAAQLLRASNLKVYEVSNRVGISNYRYFVMQFKKQMHRTPMEYRRNV